jgi:nitrate/TMAO reductase-like tetraheme cytochrome c subunit
LHLKVDCKKCHKVKLTNALAHNNCTDCHKDDHQNELDKENKDPDCSECHSVKGFTPSFYSFEKHNKSDFALNGAHLATPCFACHLKGEDWKFRQIGLQCVDCHKDIHRDFITEKFYPAQNCKVCHSENQWAEVKFDHNLTDFKLRGAHQKQNCRACHFPNSKTGIDTQNFKKFTGNCIDCHKDIHYQQFDKEGSTNCTQCHNLEQWTIENFDHSKTLFPIDGAHEKVTCKECHKENTNEKGKYIIYKLKEYKCADCHS